MPGSTGYDETDVLKHFAGLFGRHAVGKIGSQYYGQEFGVYNINKEGTINEANFVKEFVPAYVLNKRKKNLEAFREGLTLNGMSFRLI